MTCSLGKQFNGYLISLFILFAEVNNENDALFKLIEWTEILSVLFVAKWAEVKAKLFKILCSDFAIEGTEFNWTKLFA